MGSSISKINTRDILVFVLKNALIDQYCVVPPEEFVKADIMLNIDGKYCLNWRTTVAELVAIRNMQFDVTTTDVVIDGENKTLYMYKKA